jgi:hypothetical protein
MAIQDATATLTSTVTLTGHGLFLEINQGKLDFGTGSIQPIGRSSWASLAGTTWSDFRSYQTEFDPIVWTTERIDIGQVDYFTLSIVCDADGAVTFRVYTSETGVFGGEERVTEIENGDLNIPSFYGQYLYVQALVPGGVLRRLTVTTQRGSNYRVVRLTNVDTSTLGGTTAGRVLDIPLTLSSIVDIFVQPRSVTAYDFNVYVSDTATSTVVTPVIISKSVAQPTIALYGLDNYARDAVVDITVTGLPQQAMEGNTVFVIT